MTHHYKAVEKYLVENPEIQLTPRFINYAEYERDIGAAQAANLSAYRKSVNLPQARIAKIFGISLSQYKKYELGMEILRVDLAQKWSLRFSTPFFYLLQGSYYSDSLPIHRADSQFNFIWFLANSLSDKYFVKLIDIICMFKRNPSRPKTLKPSGVTRERFVKVLEEITQEMYIAIAYGLQAIRHRFDCNQELMAELLGVSVSTYQQYEKPTMKPRFNILIAARFHTGTGINPLVILAGTEYAKIRNMQNERMALIREIVEDIDQENLTQLEPLIDGFANMVRRIPGALITDT